MDTNLIQACLSVSTRDLFGADVALMGTLFVTQWLLVLEILWITTIVVPFTIMSIIFYLIDWLILDKITNFLLTGNWNDTSQIIITATSPILIMLYVGVFFGFIFLIVFFINYFGRNAFSLQASEVIKRLYWLFGLMLFVVAIPFAFLFLGFIMKFISSLITMVINPNGFSETFLKSESFKNSLLILSNYQTPEQLNKEAWDKAWETIVVTDELTQLKDSLFETFNKLSKDLNSIQFNNLIYSLMQNINNPDKLKELFNDQTLNNLVNLDEITIELQTLLQQLQQSNIESEQLESILSTLGNFNDYQTLSTFNSSLLITIQNGEMYKNIQLDEYGQIVATNNIGFMLYYSVTGIYVNSINGIWNNITFLSPLFRTNGLTNLIKSIVLGSIVALSAAKGIAQLVSILIYRWFAILALVPYGAFSTTRWVNDDGAIFKLWIRESITIFASLFVVALNVQILNLLYLIIANAFDNGAVNIPDISNDSIYISIAFMIFVIISIYSCVGFTNKVLETFNQSSIQKDGGMNQLASEYASAKSKKSTTRSNIRRERQTFMRNVNNKNTTSGKAWEATKTKVANRRAIRKAGKTSTPTK